MSQIYAVEGMKHALEKTFEAEKTPYEFFEGGVREHIIGTFELKNRVGNECQVEEPIRVFVSMNVGGFSVDVCLGRELTDDEQKKAHDFVDCRNAEGKILGQAYMFLRQVPMWSNYCEWMDEFPLSCEYLRRVIFVWRCNAGIFFRDLGNHFRWGNRNLDRILAQFGAAPQGEKNA